MINENFSIIWGMRQISFSQLQSYMASCAKRLKSVGLKPGMRVAVCAPNSIEYVILILTLWQMKLSVVPINAHWPSRTVGAYISRIGAAHTIKGEAIKQAVCFDARYNFEVDPCLDLSLEQEATVIATSGSSGEPKAAVHSWGNHYYSALGSQETIPLSAGDRWLLSLPLYHVSGIAVLARCLLSGASLVIQEGEILKAIERGKVTHLSLVTTQLQRLLADEKSRALLKSLKCILLGGSAIPQALVERSLNTGLNIYLSYGLTEMSSQVATGKPVSADRACVKILPYRQLKIADDGGILVRGETLFQGYLVGHKVQRPGGEWFPTGDLGRLDEKGCLTVLGRKDNMFISGGENIQPEEIERALLGLEGVVEALVVPKEDPEFGHRPVAFLRFEHERLSDAQITAFLKDRLPRFMVPTAFYPWPQDLISKGMKISRGEFLNRI